MKTIQALKSLNPYIWRYKKHLLWGIVFVIISNLFGVFAPFFVRTAIDLVSELVEQYQAQVDPVAQGKIAAEIGMNLLKYSGFVLGVALLRGFFLFLVRQTLIAMSRRVENDLRNAIYAHYQSLSLSFFRRNKTGDLMARITEDISRVRMYLGPGIMYTINTISLTIIVVVAMLLVNPELTLYALLPLPILSISIYLIENVVQERSDKIQSQLSRLTEFTQEIFSGIRVVKAYVREKEMALKFAMESEEYKDRSMRLALVNALFFPMIMLLVGLSTVLVVWVGGKNVIGGTVSIGNVAEFIMYINMLTWPIIAIGWVTTLIQRAAASQIRIDQLMDEKSEIIFKENGPGIRNAEIKFDNVSFTFPDTGIKAIKNFSATIKAGSKTGILGATGSGKSTLCNLVPRLFDPDEGQILIDGHDIKEFSRETLRKNVGYAPQDVFLFSESIGKNIAFGKPGAELSEIEAAAKNAGIYHNIEDFPEKFETIVGERGVTLSGGQKQRTALARAWITEPKILILDDSLSAVDTRTEELILTNLKKARTENPHMAVLMVSHRISTLQDSDHILVLEDGRLVEEGTHDELISQNGYYASTYQKQLIEAEMETEI